MTTLLCDLNETACSSGHVDGDNVWVTAGELSAATGWPLKPEGFYKGKVCVSATSTKTAPLVQNNRINASGFWRHLGHPVVHDKPSTVWVLGASAVLSGCLMSRTWAAERWTGFIHWAHVTRVHVRNAFERSSR
jgi:hypothetical protein